MFTLPRGMLSLSNFDHFRLKPALLEKPILKVKDFLQNYKVISHKKKPYLKCISDFGLIVYKNCNKNGNKRRILPDWNDIMIESKPHITKSRRI